MEAFSTRLKIFAQDMEFLVRFWQKSWKESRKLKRGSAEQYLFNFAFALRRGKGIGIFVPAL